jgi:hypothetical protein
MMPFIVSAFIVGWCISWKGGRNQIQAKSPARTFYSGNLRMRYARQNNVVLSSYSKRNFELKGQKTTLTPTLYNKRFYYTI